MKKVKSIMIVLLSVMVVGCSNKNNEQQVDSSIAIEQQTEGESQCIQSKDIAKENETPVATIVGICLLAGCGNSNIDN